MKEGQKSYNEAIEWYKSNRYRYDVLCNVVKTLIEKLLKKTDIDFHSITCRAKELDSFKEKCSNDKYSSPKDEILDMAGIRIIAYIDSDVEKISKMIESEFEIDDKNSVNKSKLLGTNQVGYRSVHYVAKISEKRLGLSEYEEFRDMVFEVQIRTILQHAWAEIEHDRYYKFNGVLPAEIMRRFNLAAGVLELIDREFESLSREIDEYAKVVEQQTKTGQLDIPINTTSILEYMSTKFDSSIIEKTLNRQDETVINELQKMGIETLAQLDQIVPSDLLDSISKLGIEETNYLGVLRDVMIISDPDKYFKVAWERKFDLDQESVNFYKNYGVPIEDIAVKYNIKIHDDTHFYFDEIIGSEK